MAKKILIGLDSTDEMAGGARQSKGAVAPIHVYAPDELEPRPCGIAACELSCDDGATSPRLHLYT